MDYIISYEIAGIIFLISLLFVSLFVYKAKTRTNLLYKSFIIYSLIGSILDVVTAFTILDTSTPQLIFINYVLAIINILAVNFTPIFYYLFVVSLTHEQKAISPKHRIFVRAFIIYDILAITTSPFTHFVMYFTSSGEYMHGFGMTVQYILFGILLFASVIEIVRHKNNLSKHQILIVLSYTIIDFAVILFQFFNPEYLFVGLASAVSLMLIGFSIRNPMELIDNEIGIYNRAAFKEFLFATKKDFSISLIHINNSDYIKYLHGTDNGYYIIRQCVKKILKEIKNPLAFYIYQDTFILVSKTEVEAKEYASKIITHKADPVNVTLKGEAKKEISVYLDINAFIIKNPLELDLAKLDDGETNKINLLLNLFDFIVSDSKDSPESNSLITMIDNSIIDKYLESICVQTTVDAAIKNETFEVFMQPIYDLKTKAFTGAESLIRLKDSNGKYISPGLFIPEAEKNGKIIALGDISIKKTCEFIKKGNLQQLGIQKVNINLSMVQCMQDNIVEHIIQILEEYDIPKTMIRFEITETVMATHPERLTNVMNSLTAFGIEFALDDYGTGYSNTSRLLNFPFSEIKFDKSFVDSAMENIKHALPLKHLIKMVSDSDMIVLVEGIENKEMSDLIENFGGNLIQGFYYAKPLPLEAFVDFIKKGLA